MILHTPRAKAYAANKLNNLQSRNENFPRRSNTCHVDQSKYDHDMMVWFLYDKTKQSHDDSFIPYQQLPMRNKSTSQCAQMNSPQRTATTMEHRLQLTTTFQSWHLK